MHSTNVLLADINTYKCAYKPNSYDVKKIARELLSFYCYTHNNTAVSRSAVAFSRAKTLRST